MNDDETWLPEPSAPPSPRELGGRYRIGRLLGRGGAGQVHAGDDLVTGEAVALKFVQRRTPAEQAQIRRELIALRRLRVRGVARLVDEFEDRDQHVMVTALIPGPDLRVAMEREPPRPLLVTVLRSLARVHRAGVLHLDLKPSNILLDATGAPVLLDFGIARGAALLDERSDRSGTPLYMAPEQRRGGTVDVRTDLYAIGRILVRAGVMLDLGEWLVAEDPADRPVDVDAVLRALGEPTEADHLAAAHLDDLVGDAAALQAWLHAPGERFQHWAEDAAQEAAAQSDLEALRRLLLRWIDSGVLEQRGERWTLQRPALEDTSGPVDAARRALARGREGLAWRLLSDAHPEGEVVRMLVRVALTSRQPALLDLARFQLDRSQVNDDGLRRLLDATRALVMQDEHRLKQLLPLPPMADEDLEHRRMGITLLARPETLDAADAWAGDGVRRALLMGWRGQRAYAGGDYETAARLHRGAALTGHPHARTSCSIHGAAALLELHRHDEAYALAREARKASRELRHASYELNAHWLARSARYRRGDELVPDPGAVADAREVSVAFAGLLGMLEASIAWRLGLPEAGQLARAAADDCSATGMEASELLALSVAAAAGEPSGDLLPRILALEQSELSLQMLALVAARRHEAATVLATIRGPRDVRRDVLSVDECVERLRV